MLDTYKSLGLGIDAGGTQTRWALAGADGVVIAEGHVGGLSALQMNSGDGRYNVQTSIVTLARDVLLQGRPCRVRAGVTGFGGDGGEQIARWLSDLLALPPQAVVLSNDIEIAYLDSFEPGQGYLVYAGTGSIAAFIDSDGQFHRAGGRGGGLDDGGGGFWIAREAMRHIWRAEDDEPGCWKNSPLACAAFDFIGGSEWDLSRDFMYAHERGDVGKLALAVAACAETDIIAHNILVGAGEELARLARSMLRRFGTRPIALSGRAAELHPLIFASMQAALPASTILTQSSGHPHIAAARIAAKGGAVTGPAFSA
jgi:glucosamine kinase